ncbi:hypothetical protein P7H11_20225 [Paenibacillus larvae]|nr:hypothetical protein [Paenibacillus larvae]
MAGPSKAGKSFALIELSIAIAEGGKWMGWPCTPQSIHATLPSLICRCWCPQ